MTSERTATEGALRLGTHVNPYRMGCWERPRADSDVETHTHTHGQGGTKKAANKIKIHAGRHKHRTTYNTSSHRHFL